MPLVGAGGEGVVTEVGVASHQQLTELHKIKHVALVHPGQLLPELDGFFPHLQRSQIGMGIGIGTGMGTGMGTGTGTGSGRQDGSTTTVCRSHLALVQVADDLLEEPLLQLLLCPRGPVVPRDQVGGAGFVGPLRGSNRDTFRPRGGIAPAAAAESGTSSSSACSSSVYAASV